MVLTASVKAVHMGIYDTLTLIHPYSAGHMCVKNPPLKIMLKINIHLLALFES